MNEELYRAMARSVLEGEAEEAEKLAEESISSGIDPLDAINLGFVAGVEEIGDQFSCGEAFLPQLVMAGEAMKGALSTLEPEMAKKGVNRDLLGTVVLGTIAGDDTLFVACADSQALGRVRKRLLLLGH